MSFFNLGVYNEGVKSQLDEHIKINEIRLPIDIVCRNHLKQGFSFVSIYDKNWRKRSGSRREMDRGFPGILPSLEVSPVWIAVLRNPGHGSHNFWA